MNFDSCKLRRSFPKLLQLDPLTGDHEVAVALMVHRPQFLYRRIDPCFDDFQHEEAILRLHPSISEKLLLRVVASLAFHQRTLAWRDGQRPGIGLKIPPPTASQKFLHLLRPQQGRHTVVDVPLH